MENQKYHFKCINCGKVYHDKFMYLCPDCAKKLYPDLYDDEKES